MNRAGRPAGSAPGLRACAFWLLASCLAAPVAAQAPADAATHSLPFFPSAADASRTGVARVINRSDEAGSVQIDAFDDTGAEYGPLTLSIDALATVHFNSNDLENGNPEIGLEGGTGAGQGDWRLVLTSTLDIEVLGYVRTAEGLLATMHDLVADSDGRYRVPTFNPASNATRVSLLRLVNPGNQAADVSIAGVDDSGASPGGAVTLSIPPGASRSYSSAQLEAGDADGLRGSLGDGAGKWQLLVESGQPIVVMSLVASAEGNLSNLSTSPWAGQRVPRHPDLAVATPQVSNARPEPGAAYRLSATVTNAGNGASPETTLRFYRSHNSLITSQDTQIASDVVGALPALAASTSTIERTAPSTATTHYYGACVDAVADEPDTSNNCSRSVRVVIEEPPTFPDLEVTAFRVDDPNPEEGERFTLQATVANAGDGESKATVLRYYRSTNATISSSDTEVGTDSVGTLRPSGTDTHSIALTATTVGTSYYGACIDPVPEESNTANNCSAPVQVDVKEAPKRPNLYVESLDVSDATPRVGTSFTLSARVRNRGDADSGPTTLRFVQSTDATISSADAQLGTSEVGALSVRGRSDHSITLTAPSTAGRVYYGACVDRGAGEVHTADNCSLAIQVNVEPTPVTSSGFNIDLVFPDPKPSSGFQSAFHSAAGVWEGIITGDLPDVDFVNNPQNNPCTDVPFNGFVDDLRIYVYVEDIDGVGGTAASAGYCTGRSSTPAPVIGLVQYDAADLAEHGNGIAYLVAVHEIAHVLGFGISWDVVNPSLVRGEPVVPPPDTYWPGSRAVAAFDKAYPDYEGGKVPVENEHGGRGAQDRHWRRSVFPGEIMTHTLSGNTISAVTIQSMVDLGYTIGSGRSGTSVVLPKSAAESEVPLRCGVDTPDLRELETVPQ